MIRPNPHILSSPLQQIMEWFIHMCLALEHLHSHKTLHRDLKPSNIFLTKKNLVKLGDFGVSKVLESTLQNASELTLATS